jgi:hypothetical protein
MQCILCEIIFGRFFICTTKWYATYMHFYVDKKFILVKSGCYSGWPKHYPIVHLWSEVRYHPIHQHMKLLSLGIPYVPYAPVHNSNMVTGARRLVLNRLRWGLPLSRPIFSTFPWLPCLVSNYANHSIILLNHIGPPILEKGPIASGFHPLVFYQ